MNSKRIIRIGIVLIALIMLGALIITSLLMLFGLSKPEHPEDLNQAMVGKVTLLWMFVTLIAVYDLHIYFRKEDFKRDKGEK